ncbi:TetR/AcrR family transcriptional regulator [Modestobacter muralis]|uniref:TetR/AcrR family transcriptional regulator n=1 Tax=Modestobacter muralis TaxID=1608614 RepID=A0A6P0H2W6_9ACTN|nr:TetR/AcrR family transcriptional regulator [Modestobacter muralis]NEK93194.1 TetR/AcrR family transcriptional regulator [Modestobacter muralis]NEN49961.1 TetR/AcrR family transcriptional regulator [Modestobacter muralis]
MTDTATDGTPRERADSRRKRLRLIEAARAAIAEHGLDASTTDITERAEVGVGTLYRRFGSKEALIADVLVDGVREIRAWADAALSDPDAWRGLSCFLFAYTEAQLKNIGLAEFTSGTGTRHDLPPQVAEAGSALADAIDRLVQRAQEQGSLRDDVAWRDIVLISISPSGGVECLGATQGPQQWRRTIAIALDGLRGPAASSLPPG